MCAHIHVLARRSTILRSGVQKTLSENLLIKPWQNVSAVAQRKYSSVWRLFQAVFFVSEFVFCRLLLSRSLNGISGIFFFCEFSQTCFLQTDANCRANDTSQFLQRFAHVGKLS